MKLPARKSICVSSGVCHTTIWKYHSGRRAPFELEHEGKVIARFDTEEKARMYQDAFEEGAQAADMIRYREEKERSNDERA